MLVNPLLVLLGIIVFENLCLGIFYWHFTSYDIPVTVLRFMGNKQRPALFHRRAKKRMVKGVPRLFVKGYKGSIRDYLSKNYYPSIKGKYGALAVWELEDGVITPVIPTKVKLSKEQARLIDEAARTLQTHKCVSFAYDDRMHYQIAFKIVDDVDVEFGLQEYLRVDNQYRTGFREFLHQFAIPITFVLLGCLALAGWVVWLKEQPNLAAQCLSAGKSGMTELLKQYAASAAAPGG